jgi:hypothetical protein
VPSKFLSKPKLPSAQPIFED